MNRSQRKHPLYPDADHQDSNDKGAISPPGKKIRITDYPNEVLVQIIGHVDDPIALNNLTQTCSIFRDLTTPNVWKNIFDRKNAYYSAGSTVDHLRGANKAWRIVGLDDHFRNKRDWVDPQQSFSMSGPPCLVMKPSRAKHIRPPHMPTLSSDFTIAPVFSALSNGGPPDLSTDSTVAPVSSPWSNGGPPASSTDSTTQTTIVAYLQRRTFNAHSEYQLIVYGLPNHETPLETITSDFWAHPGLDQNADPEDLIVAQLMDIKHYPHQRDDQGRIRIVFVVAFGNRNLAGVDAGESELSVVESWQKIKVAEAYISDKLPAPISRNSEDTTGPQLISFRPQPARGKVETIVPHNTQQTIRGRIIKLYSVKDPLTAEIQDHIALIGILQGSRAQTVVMTSPLFVSKTPKQLSARDGTSMTRDETITPKQLSARDGTSMTRDETIMTTPSTAAPTQSKWTCHALGGGTRALSTSCMSLFPPQSDFEHLLVIMDQGGNAQIWDWLRKLRVAVLKAPESGADTASQGQERASVSRNELFYWGVQINWAIEEPVFQDQKPNSPFLSHRKHGDFRIVALADGQDKEWETSTWFVSEKELRKREEVLSNLQEGEKFESWELNAKYRYFQQSTLGRRYIPGASPETITSTSSQVQELLFIAYLIWDHYRISLTSNNGICIFDMNQECGKAAATFSNSSVHTPLPEPPQWVTYLDNAEEDPLVDIAAVGDALFLTRKHSHMIWPFRSVVVEE